MGKSTLAISLTISHVPLLQVYTIENQAQVILLDNIIHARAHITIMDLM